MLKKEGERKGRGKEEKRKGEGEREEGGEREWEGGGDGVLWSCEISYV